MKSWTEENHTRRLFLQGLDTSQACPWLAWEPRTATPFCNTLNSSRDLTQKRFFPQTVLSKLTGTGCGPTGHCLPGPVMSTPESRQGITGFVFVLTLCSRAGSRGKHIHRQAGKRSHETKLHNAGLLAKSRKGTHTPLGMLGWCPRDSMLERRNGSDRVSKGNAGRC